MRVFTGWSCMAILMLPYMVCAQPASLRASLHQSIRDLSVLSARTGIAKALATAIDSQVVLLWDDAPIVRGVVAAKRLV